MSKEQALELRQALERRLAECQLQLHPQKTKVVYCKDANRPGDYPERSFDFLGYTFRSRIAIGRNHRRFVSFIPAVSDNAGKRMRLKVRRWRLHLRSDLDLEEIAKWVRPALSGWVRYYGRFHPSRLREALRTILTRSSCGGCLANTNGSGDILWRPGNGYARSGDATLNCSPIGPWDLRLDDGSRMNREVHVRFWESVGLRCPTPLTYPKACESVREARSSIGKYLEFYNQKRPRSSLDDRTPDEAYFTPMALPEAA